MSKLRLPYSKLSPQAYQGLLACKTALENSTLGAELITLVYLRVSQINGCAFCLKLHTSELRRLQVSSDKIDTLGGWRISNDFSETERAALDWAERVTNISAESTSDSNFQQLKTHFSDSEITDLTIAISLMNALNRVAVSLRQ
nr:carboxymuconolactone decarboxylase family protein [uncultured Moellerella sp.]